MSTSTAPSPLTWTLRLKHHKTTVLLHCDPLQTFQSIKTALLAALNETNPTGTLNNRPLPSSPDEIILGRPVDLNNPERGFSLGEWEKARGGLDADESEGAGKGKGKRKSIAGEGMGTKDCLKGAGLRDGVVLAFRWGEEDEDEDEGEEDMEMGLGEKKENWDVVLPAYEDAYGVENTGDLGGRKEFVG
ncbi:hypothetical protein AOQ84DRAFT_352331 [Glonium stellatum]|uniref:Uncharacterized protein n=1 Tax=Glonium stellatum TaxID=574774 RepID=A0A8E2F991_9PEZI|nr:hypothetical protein AOQ84DRAFT_352331 [Glonium stellatum]